jgi:gliding motility-associated-like protein
LAKIGFEVDKVSHMKFKHTVLLNIFFLSQIALSQNEWSWQSGEKSTNVGRVYGTRGVANPQNNPGSRIGAAFWTDKQGNLWLFGGRGNDESSRDSYLSDLWRFDVATGMWTWMGGDKDTDSRGAYKGVGISDKGNNPGARRNSISWADSNGDFWLFGGRGMSSRQDNSHDNNDEGDDGLLNDLWKYSPASGVWTFVSGTARLDQRGRYGTRMEASASNYPGGRYSAHGWIDTNGNLWLFGGRGYTTSDNILLLDDVWKYSPSQNTWVWITGNKAGNAKVNYGEKGQFAEGNTPGGRNGSISCVDNNGGFWLFGGGTLIDLFADLWKFDHVNNKWAWIGGSANRNQGPLFANPGVPDANGNPGARTLSAVWVDAENSVWLFGGNGYGGLVGSNPLNSLWKYSIRSNEWTYVKGDVSVNPVPVYGSRGTADPGNTPGGTASSSFWKDNEGNFWLFGGRSSSGYLNQVWKLERNCAGEISGKISPPSATICAGSSQVLTVSGGTSYEWRRNNIIIPGETRATVTVTEPGTYSVIIRNGNCNGPASNVSVITAGVSPTGTITPASASICEGGSQALTASGGTSYEWRRNGNTINGETSAILTAKEPGTYTVIIKNGNCSAEASNTSLITIASVAGIRYADVTVSPNTSIRLSARPLGTSYEWSPTTGLDDPFSPAPMATVTQDIQYLVRITPEQGCLIIDTVNVKVGAEKKVFVPTAFTPNGNSINDRLRPLGIAQIEYFKVFNRWGNKVYETNQVGAGWDGRYEGVDQVSDTYMWILSGKLSNGEHVKLSGRTLLIR